MLKKAIAKLLLAQKVKHNLSQEQVYDFFRFGQDSMEEYLLSNQPPQEDIDVMIQRVDVLLEQYHDDIESAIYDAVSEYVIQHGQWRELVMSSWFDDQITPMIDEAIGYVTTTVDDEQVTHPPANVGYLEKERMKQGADALAEAVLDGMQTAEEQYFEDILFKEFQTLIPPMSLGEEEDVHAAV
jgi:hypothetical protein